MYYARIKKYGTLLSAALITLPLAHADNGNAPKFGANHLNQLNCAAGEVAKFNGLEWACGEDIGTNSIAPTTPAERFVDNRDGTFTDTELGLMWEKKDAADGMPDPANPHDMDNYYTWSNAADGTNPDGTVFTNFLATLNQETADDPESSCFANHCDWRIPRLAELRTLLMTPCYAAPCIDPLFGPTMASTYWSSTSYTAAPTSAWVVNFNMGSAGLGGKNTAGNVRAVRSAP